MDSTDLLVEELAAIPANRIGRPPTLNRRAEGLYAQGGPTVLDGNGKPTIAKIRYSHDAMVDLIIGNPWVSQNELAAHFGYSPAWISTVIASDAFQERLVARKDELIDPTIRATVEERFRALINKSMEVLMAKLTMPVHQVDGKLALATMDTVSRALGYGARDKNAGATNIQFIVQVPAKAESSKTWEFAQRDPQSPPALAPPSQDTVVDPVSLLGGGELPFSIQVSQENA